LINLLLPKKKNWKKHLAVCNEDLKVERVTSMFNHLNVRHDAEKAMDYFYNLALSELEKIASVSEEKKQPLLALAEYLIKREEYIFSHTFLSQNPLRVFRLFGAVVQK
jgi:geranylgeranyl pyrophosphate synthase